MVYTCQFHTYAHQYSLVWSQRLFVPAIVSPISLAATAVLHPSLSSTADAVTIDAVLPSFLIAWHLFHVDLRGTKLPTYFHTCLGRFFNVGEASYIKFFDTPVTLIRSDPDYTSSQ